MSIKLLHRSYQDCHSATPAKTLHHFDLTPATARASHFHFTAQDFPTINQFCTISVLHSAQPHSSHVITTNKPKQTNVFIFKLFIRGWRHYLHDESTTVTTILLNAVLDCGLLPLYIHPIRLLIAVLPRPEELAAVMVERFKTYFILIVILIQWGPTLLQTNKKSCYIASFFNVK